MHQDNKLYLISLCSLMSQLKGLVLPLSMRLAERIVCRLVSAGLWRSWSTFKMLVWSLRSCYIRARCQSTAQLQTARYTVELIASDEPVVQTNPEKEHDNIPILWLISLEL